MTSLKRIAFLAAMVLPLLAPRAGAARTAVEASTGDTLVAASSSRALLRTVVLLPGDVSRVSLSGSGGTMSITNSNPAAVSAVVTGSTLAVTAIAPGKATVLVKEGRKTRAKIAATVRAPMSVSPAALSVKAGESATARISDRLGSAAASSSNTAVATAYLDGESVVVRGRAAGAATVTVRDSRTTRTVAVTVTPAEGGSGGGGGGTVSGTTEGRLLASNCFQCHGTYGSGGFDRISGKSEAELLEELNEFLAGGEDPGGIMAAHLQGYTAAQLEAIARYLSHP